MFQTTMDYGYALVMDNDNQCNVTKMITTEVVMMVGIMRCLAYAFTFK